DQPDRTGPYPPGNGRDMSRTIRHDQTRRDETDPRSDEELLPRDDAEAADDLADDLDEDDDTALEGEAEASAPEEAPAEADFAAGARDEYPGSPTTWRRVRFHRLAKCRKLAAELSPRTELLERLTDELNDVADELRHLVKSRADADCPADPAKRERALREAV